MIYFIIGTVIGIVMGFTGSGGALVAIPLFMQFLHKSLKDASVLSLVTVILASIINFIPKRKEADIKTGLIMLSTGFIGSYLSLSLKEGLSNQIIASLLALISLYSLYMVWKPVRDKDHSPEVVGVWGIILALIAGLILGVLTTLTGIGGGVLLMPIFIGQFKFSPQKAVATSLLTIFLSSVASLFLQVKEGFELPPFNLMMIMGLGILCAVGALTVTLKFIADGKINRIRQVLFTFIVITALSKIFIGS